MTKIQEASTEGFNEDSVSSILEHTAADKELTRLTSPGKKNQI